MPNVFGQQTIPMLSGQESLDVLRRLAQGELHSRIARGLHEGVQDVIKFGRNPDIDFASTPEVIWSLGGAYNYASGAETLYLSSAHTSDNSRITVLGLSENYEAQSLQKSLNGQSLVTLTGLSWIRSFRAYNSGATRSLGTIFVGATTTLSGGMPTPQSEIRAVIASPMQQTEMCVYTVPSGFDGVLHRWSAETGSGGGSAEKEADVQLEVRNFGGVFRGRDHRETNNRGSRIIQNYHLKIPLSPKDDIQLRCTDVNANNGIHAGFEITLYRRSDD